MKPEYTGIHNTAFATNNIERTIRFWRDLASTSLYLTEPNPVPGQWPRPEPVAEEERIIVPGEGKDNFPEIQVAGTGRRFAAAQGGAPVGVVPDHRALAYRIHADRTAACTGR